MTEGHLDFEDDRAYLTKEAQTRRRYLRWFNKRRDDFKTDAEYDDYLEMVEDIIFNLVNNIDVEATKSRVEKYRRENADSIGQNHAKRLEEDRVEAERVSVIERERLARLAELRKQDEELEKQKEKQRRQEEAEELIRVSKGEDALAKIRRKQEKAKRKQRRKEEAAAKAAEEKEKPDFRPMWFRPQFPSPLPVPVDLTNITADQRPGEGATVFEHRSAAEKARAASAAGFRQQYVYERAMSEFKQSFRDFGL